MGQGLSRRSFIRSVGAGCIAAGSGLRQVNSLEGARKVMPSWGDSPLVIGLGTWITFNVEPSPELRAARTEVMPAFLDHGAGMVDSSPMSGSA